VPVSVPGVNAALLDPRAAWADGDAYDRTARELVGKFAENFALLEGAAEITANLRVRN